MVNLFSGIRDFFTHTIPNGLNTFANKTGNFLNDFGHGFINGWNSTGNKVNDIWNGITNIPVVGGLIKASPVGSAIGSAIGIGRSVGNMMSGAQSGDWGKVANSGKDLITQAGQSGMPSSAGDLLSSLKGLKTLNV